jgi:hypothetical protein
VRVIAAGAALRARAQPAALLEQRVDPRVELRRRRVDVLRRAHHALGGELHLLEDTLPFGNLRRGAHALELAGEGLRRRIARRARRAPGAAARRQVARQRVKALHRRRLAEVLDQRHAAPCAASA